MMLAISIAVVLLLALLFAWLAVWAWRARRALVKWPGAILAGLVAALCTLVVALALTGLYRIYVPVGAPSPDVQIEASSEQLARGEDLAQLCVGCHSTTGDLPLDGSEENFAEEFGTLYAPNLTPGGPLADWTDGEIMRAIREGVDRDGRALLLMPSDQFHRMSDADVRALVGYLRSQPAVERDTPERHLNLLGTVIVGTGMYPISTQPPLTGPVAAPPVGPTPAYGEYLVTISGCRECHGDDLRGGTSQFVPVGPNLPAIVSQWSPDEFLETIRTGTDPFGNDLDPDTMPWREYSTAYGDEELTAIYEYIRSLPASETTSE